MSVHDEVFFFFSSTDWLNTPQRSLQKNVLKLRNAFLGNAERRRRRRERDRRKNPEAGSKLCRVKASCVNGLLHKFRYVSLLPTRWRHRIYVRSTRFYICRYTYVYLLESLINISHSDRVQWNSLSYHERSWGNWFIPHEFEYCEIWSWAKRVRSVRVYKICHTSIQYINVAKRFRNVL